MNTELTHFLSFFQRFSTTLKKDISVISFLTNQKKKNPFSSVSAFVFVLFFLFFGAITDTNAQCSPILGDQSSYGVDSWIGYVYSTSSDNTAFTSAANPPTDALTNPYRGYVTQPATFDLNLEAQTVNSGSIYGPFLCGTHANYFGVRYKMQKTFTAGYYNITVGGDDGYRLSVDGGTTFVINKWVDQAYTSTSTSIYLSGSTNLVLEYYEKTGSSRVLFSYIPCAVSTEPTAITGTTEICAASSTTLTATGGVGVTGSKYQWGTGSVVGSNIINTAGDDSPTKTFFNINSTTTYWVRRIDPAPCSFISAGITKVVTVSTVSTAPTSISGTTSICSGSSTTLTAVGGTTGTGGTYQWGTGTVGSNTIVGATTSTLTVTPTVGTTYWVRRVDPTPCNTITAGITAAVTVAIPSTAPTSITGNSTICPGTSTILTASGGTATSGSAYQWGTGTTIGANIIAGQTAASIIVAPTVATTYWVRRTDLTPCTFTSGITFATIMSTTLQSDPSVFGNNVWNVYAYNGTDINLGVSNIYQGYYSVSTLGTNTQVGTNSWGYTLSPSSSAGWVGCTVNNDNFTMVHKRRGFPCGTYSINMDNWDDATVVYINGVQAWTCAGWSGGNTCTGAVGIYTLDANSTIEIRVVENGGLANVSMTLTSTGTYVSSTAPTTISGTTALCSGTSTTLTASGGISGTIGVFQWGTGSTVGSNIISGQSTASITVSPTTTTTYWVRRADSTCNYTSGQTKLVTVDAVSFGGTISGGTTVCSGTNSTILTLNNNIGNVSKWQSSTVSTFSSNVTDIASTTTTLTATNLTATTYYRAVVGNGVCASINSATATITINSLTVSGVVLPNLSATCSSSTASDLTLTSYLGSVIKWQKSSDAAFTSPIDIASTSATLSGTTIGNLSATTYFRAVVQNGICGTAYSSVATISVTGTTWNGTSWSNGLPTSASTVTMSGNYTSTGDLYACSLTINSNATVVVNSGNNFIVTGAVTVVSGSSLTFESNANLVQSGTVNNNSGSIIIKRNTSPLMRLDYVLWSSPVAGQNLLSFSPLTSLTPTSRFYTYNPTTDKYNSIVSPATTNFATGAGYLIRMPNTFPSATPTAFQGQFQGVPNNGNYDLTVANNTYNAIGNPYPSAIDADLFISLNNTAGALYFWRKTNNTQRSSYATYTMLGATANVGGLSSIMPSEFIQVGQGFIVKSNSTTISFTNEMRLVDNGNIFLRNATVEKSRIWLNLSSDTFSENQMMVGYVAGATNDIDQTLDGRYINDSPVALNSSINNEEFAIQARGLPFVATDVVPLAFKTSIAGNYSIAIDHVDGLFLNDQDVLLKDNLTGTIHNLKENNYGFATEAGVFNSRFEIVYQNPLATNQPIFNENNVVVYKQNQELVINTGAITMANVKVYDIRGRLLAQKSNINDKEARLPLNTANAVLIVKITSNTDGIVTKKVVF